MTGCYLFGGWEDDVLEGEFKIQYSTLALMSSITRERNGLVCSCSICSSRDEMIDEYIEQDLVHKIQVGEGRASHIGEPFLLFMHRRKSLSFLISSVAKANCEVSMLESLISILDPVQRCDLCGEIRAGGSRTNWKDIITGRGWHCISMSHSMVIAVAMALARHRKTNSYSFRHCCPKVKGISMGGDPLLVQRQPR